METWERSGVLHSLTAEEPGCSQAQGRTGTIGLPFEDLTAKERMVAIGREEDVCLRCGVSLAGV